MKKSLMLLLTNIIFLTTSSLVFAGGHSGNGGGLSEINVIEAWSGIEQTIHLLESRYKDIFTISELEYLEKIKINASKRPDELIFKSSSLEPRIFAKDENGVFSRFKSGADIEDSVIINLDRLDVLDVGSKAQRSMNSEEALQFVFIILKSKFHTDIDFTSFMAKLNVLYSNYYEVFNHSEYLRSDIGLEVSRMSDFRIFVTSDNNKIEITKEVQSILECLDGSTGKLNSISHLSSSGIGPYLVDLKGATILYTAEARYECNGDSYLGDLEIKTLYTFEEGIAPRPIWYQSQHLKTFISLENVVIILSNIEF